jgi:type IV secretion system protein VirD4
MTRSGAPPESSLHPAEVLAVFALAAIGFATLLLWLAGGIAGLAFEGSWPGVAAAELPGVALRLRDHLDDPSAAWPAPSRSGLPGPVAMYAAITLSGAIVAAVATASVTVWRRTARPGRLAPANTASWASSRDLAPLLVKRPVAGRLTLGRLKRRLVAAEPGQSTLVVAPTQTGKTSGLAIPAILEWPGPVLATSVKSDLLHDTHRHRATLGRVELFDPASSTGRPSQSWTPLASCMTWDGARRVAHWLTEGAAPAKRNLSDGDFWYAAAAKLLAPLLFAAASTGRTMAHVIAWIDTQEESAVLRALQGTHCEEALNAMQASWTRDDRQRSSIYTTAETIVEAYADPGVLAHSEMSEISPTRLLDGGCHTLYLSATVREQRRLRPVFVTLLESVIEEAYRQAARRGKPIDPPLLIVLDEAANIAPLPDLDVIAATGAGHGVQLVTVLQDLAQAHERWGRDRAQTIVNNHRAKLIGAGSADARTLDYAAHLIGDGRFLQTSSSGGAQSRRTVTESSTYRMLAPPHAIRQGSAHSAVLVYGNLPPAWVTLRAWFADEQLRRMAEPPVGGG